MTLKILLDRLSDLLIGDTSIERHPKAELQRAKANALPPPKHNTLAAPFLEVMAQQNAHGNLPLGS